MGFSFSSLMIMAMTMVACKTKKKKGEKKTRRRKKTWRMLKNLKHWEASKEKNKEKMWMSGGKGVA